MSSFLLEPFVSDSFFPGLYIYILSKTSSSTNKKTFVGPSFAINMKSRCGYMVLLQLRVHCTDDVKSRTLQRSNRQAEVTCVEGLKKLVQIPKVAQNTLLSLHCKWPVSHTTVVANCYIIDLKYSGTMHEGNYYLPHCSGILIVTITYDGIRIHVCRLLSTKLTCINYRQQNFSRFGSFSSISPYLLLLVQILNRFKPCGM